ncbi:MULTISPECIES: sirohydrochlorin chelatase [Prescottella]|uniref:Cobalamin biosynthesis protein n=1 Tax=Rhodococcus hoagii TaxID=43767 RepID=A0AAE5IUM5_RHOHA|nr:sirohydrochlorin chelatase [Prescottella equi]AVP69207.1 sirohydrochlorin chelatase [Prescottella equi]MBM4537124.1 sirohydrochlorin chelatase [Prescottella equi]MBM4630066.1 sirohydrochlorin chelatase [Prescottella equi]MBM4696356.1 sirohydrochlorin chelatase [Prescottella equi]MBM4731377.1 sirohydrochlorin chelatase [Prescottella equi]
MTPLIAVAHGSRDPRSARVVTAAVAAIRAQRPDVDVRLCFLDLNTPSVDQVVDAVAAEGHTAAVVVPLLLGSAFHARVDLPGILAAARARHPQLTLVQSDVLGHDRRLVDAVRDRITETGVATDDTRAGVVLAAVGSSDSRANDRTRALAGVLADGNLWATAACFATSAEPTVGQAISQLRSRGVERIVIAPWFLAPGRLTDRLGAAALDAAPDVVFAETIGAHRNVAEVALDRYRTALGAADSWRLSA